jgi:ferredoxin-NADP reductase
MLAKKYRSKVVSVKNPFEGIYTLEFESQNGKFKYRPGQFLHLAIDSQYDGSDQWPDSRCFSMQSNPEEPSIKITYSVKGKFTQRMKQQLRVGSEVWLKLPYGDLFTQKHNKVNTVFIAGGTGITPFLSLFSHDSFKDYINSRIYLGFKSQAYNFYSDALGNFNTKELKIIYEDAEGFMNINSIFKENGIASDYFISGPPQMIKGFKQGLIINGVSPNQILTDEWN